MNYLAFDIEAANGFKLYSICSIGFVIADEKFNIIKQFNLWINPKTKYNLNGTRSNVEINLNLDKEVLIKSPIFSERFDEINQLLTNKDYCIVGHAVESDVRMLNAALKKYKLKPINFEFICSQLLYKSIVGDKDVKSLTKIADELNEKFNAHSADEDAKMSMLTLKHLTINTGKTLNELLGEYQIRIGKTENFELTRSISLLNEASRKKATQAAVLKIVGEITALRKKHKIKPQPFSMNIAFSRNIEISNGQALSEALDKLVRMNAQYTSKTGKCNLFVHSVTDEVVDDARTIYINNQINAGKKIARMSIEEFMKYSEDEIMRIVKEKNV